MLNHIRLMFIALFMGVFLVACGDDTDKQDAMDDSAAPAEMSSDAAPAAEADSEMAAEEDSIEGMTHEEAVAKWGEPDVTETRTIDALTIVHNEWHGDDGITAVQFENGVATYSQFIPAK
jgi:hypothetical protein